MLIYRKDVPATAGVIDGKNVRESGYDDDEEPVSIGRSNERRGGRVKKPGFLISAHQAVKKNEMSLLPDSMGVRTNLGWML